MVGLTGWPRSDLCSAPHSQPMPAAAASRQGWAEGPSRSDAQRPCRDQGSRHPEAGGERVSSLSAAGPSQPSDALFGPTVRLYPPLGHDSDEVGSRGPTTSSTSSSTSARAVDDQRAAVPQLRSDPRGRRRRATERVRARRPRLAPTTSMAGCHSNRGCCEHGR